MHQLSLVLAFLLGKEVGMKETEVLRESLLGLVLDKVNGHQCKLI